MRLTNIHGISLPLAVWLLHDDYDYVNDPNYVSATSMLKSTRQLVLSRRVNQEEREIDISTLLNSRLGSAIHDSMEKAWRANGAKALKLLGYPEHIWSNIVVNPTADEITANPSRIPVWIEQRSFRKITIDGVEYTIGGKFDQVIQGRLFDAKSTSVYTYLLNRKDEDYAMQGGIYKWLNPELITSDHVFIQFIFTDWQKARAKADPENYPQTRVLEYPVALPSMEEVERFIASKIREIIRYKNAADEQIPYCTDQELWRSEPQYKYYADPAKTKRSTKNFDDKAEAYAHLASKGKGVVKEVPGDVKACEFCPAFNACKQKDLYYAIA